MLQSVAITPAPAKSHLLIAAGHAAVEPGHRVRYNSVAELVETLYRGLADNSVGRIIDTLLRNDVVLVDVGKNMSAARQRLPAWFDWAWKTDPDGAGALRRRRDRHVTGDA